MEKLNVLHKTTQLISGPATDTIDPFLSMPSSSYLESRGGSFLTIHYDVSQVTSSMAVNLYKDIDFYSFIMFVPPVLPKTLRIP